MDLLPTILSIVAMFAMGIVGWVLKILFGIMKNIEANLKAQITELKEGRIADLKERMETQKKELSTEIESAKKELKIEATGNNRVLAEDIEKRRLADYDIYKDIDSSVKGLDSKIEKLDDKREGDYKEIRNLVSSNSVELAKLQPKE